MTLPDFISAYDFAPMCEQYRIWNERINVISRKDIDNVWEHHILHSLGIALYLQSQLPDEFKRGTTVLDVGCGGGFPGIPLAAIFPEVHFTLCDSIGKKVRVAEEVAKALGLTNVECVHSRVEDLPSERRWDWIVSRAVTSLDNFMPWVKGRYNSGILYLKGGDISEELAACRKKFTAGFAAPSAATVAPAHATTAMPSVTTWLLSSVFDDPYYAEKLVVHLK